MLDSTVTTLPLSCLCGASHHTFTVPTSSLPLQTHLCSCNTSRRISGTLLTSYVDITDDSKPDLTALTPYESSDKLTRYFCSTCGTHMYLEYHDDGHFEVATGAFEISSTDGILDFKDHLWIGDTGDGGATDFLTHIHNHPLGRYLQDFGSSPKVPDDWKQPSLQASTSTTTSATLHAHCHCTSVSFYLTGPTSASNPPTTKAAYPDLIIPFHSALPKENTEEEAWWLPRPSRYLAGSCACVSCRKALGFDIAFWAFVPVANITLDAEGMTPFSDNEQLGGVKTYESSEGTERTFCEKCGANVFWDGRGDGKERVIDVAVGLLDAPSGARAEEWLAWWPGRVSFEEEALNKGLIGGLGEGLKEWGRRTEGRECVAVGEVRGR